jgi:NAD(P)H-dependent FMN reductase
MPVYDQDDHERNGFPPKALEFQELLNQYDGLLIASPEYNASLPAALKNALDWASRKSDKFNLGEVFKGKVAAIMTASPGAFGGIRCLGHLHDVLTILLVNTLPSQIAVTFVGDKFDGDSEEMTDEKTRKILEDLGAALADMLKKTHGGEENVESETSDISNKQ